MNKYLVTIEFRYSDVPDAWDSTHRSKKFTIGVYDSIEDAIVNGNKQLEIFEKHFKLNTAWNRKERFSKDNKLISDLAYLQTPFQFFAKIDTLVYCNIEQELHNVMQAVKNYKEYQSAQDQILI